MSMSLPPWEQEREQTMDTDTRKHYAVPMTVTCKVENADEATELCQAVAAFLVQRIKGVSASMPPTVGVPQDVTAAPLTAAEQQAIADLGIALGSDAPENGSGDEDADG